MSLFFFFQAEDGIRDKLVTGVQTCALPISSGSNERELTREPWRRMVSASGEHLEKGASHEVLDVEKLSLLFELSRGFNALIELDELLPQVIASTKEVFQAEGCALLLFDEERQEL